MTRAGRIAAACALLLAAGGAAVFALRGGASAPLPTLPGAAETRAAGGHDLPFGPVRPARALPDATLRLDDGSERRLSELTTGGFTILQLMFAGCATTCPLQGAIFRDAQVLAAKEGVEARLLSVSVDALGDDPARLSAWLRGVGATAGWRAGVPGLQDLGPLLDALQGRGKDYDVHDARAYLVDPEGRLVFVSEDLPSPAALVSLLRQAAAARAGAKS